MDDLFSMRSSAIPAGARLVSFRGVERLCRPFEFEIYFVLVEHADFDMGAVIGAKANLRADRRDRRAPLTIHGIVSSLQHMHEVDGRALYRATLVPRLWLLGQTRHSRVFTKKTVPEVLRAVLEDAGLTGDELELRLREDYPVEEHICQYEESDLDFLHRWMEAEGIYYFFEHGDDHEVLVITDHASSHEPLDDKPVRYHPHAGQDRSAGEAFDAFTCQHVALPAEVKLSDYDYADPGLEMVGSAKVSATGKGKINVHGARFFTPARGQRLADVRAQAMLARQVLVHASGTALHLRTGYTFQLDDHPRAAFNAKYLVTAARHFGNQITAAPEMQRLVRTDFDEVYRVEVTAIRAGVQYRPERETAWPRIYGFENGVIEGPADSEYAQIDDQGRYRVKLKFDESDLEGDKASTWVRMMQPHGGGVEGWHFPLRKGTEVVLSFLGGDPDRPVISGVVPNTHKPSPVTAANHTTNVIQTGGRNRIEIEDKKGAERITLKTPYSNSRIRFGAPNAGHTMIVETDGPTLLHAGEDWDVEVGVKLNEVVHGDVSEKYLSNKSEMVPSGTVTEEYLGPHTTTVHTVRREILNEQKVWVKAGRDDQIDGGWRQIITGDVKREVKGSGTFTYTGPHSVTADESIWLVKGPGKGFFVGATMDTFVGLRTTTFVGGQVSLTVAGTIAIKAAQELNVNMGFSSTISVANTLNLTAGMRLTMSGGIALAHVSGIDKRVSAFRIRQAALAMGTASNWVMRGANYLLG